MERIQKFCNPSAVCCRCGDFFRPGDDYYDVPGAGAICPDCMDGLLEDWRRTEGDVLDRI